jgi:hypothetical protein
MLPRKQLTALWVERRSSEILDQHQIGVILLCPERRATSPDRIR